MEQFEKIEQYALGKLTAEERIAFEEKIATDPAMADALSNFRKSQMAIKAAARHQLREKTAKAYSSQVSATNRKYVLIQRIAVAAGFLLLLAAGFWYYNQDGNAMEPDILFVQNFEMPAAPAVRSYNNPQDGKWEQTLQFYGANNFDEAIPLLSELLEDETFDQKETAKLLWGASLLATHQADKALFILDQINDAKCYKQEKEWYRALAFLLLNKLDAAKSALEQIAGQKNHYKMKEAAQMLKHL